jgi:hypothetical protein
MPGLSGLRLLSQHSPRKQDLTYSYLVVVPSFLEVGRIQMSQAEMLRMLLICEEWSFAVTHSIA